MDKKLVTIQQNNEILRKFGKEKLQAFQDSFPELFNISLCLLSIEGQALTVWSNPSLFCHFIFNKNRERCLQERQKSIQYIFSKNQTGIFNCYIGLTYFCVPIYMDRNPIGFFYGGPVCLEENKKLAGKIGMDVPIISERKLQNIIQFLENLFKLLNISEDTAVIMDHNPGREYAFLQNKLSFREIEVVKLIATGLSNKEISQNLFISESTVKTHVSNILKKLELKNRMEILFFCQENTTG